MFLNCSDLLDQLVLSFPWQKKSVHMHSHMLMPSVTKMISKVRSMLTSENWEKNTSENSSFTKTNSLRKLSKVMKKKDRHMKNWSISLRNILRRQWDLIRASTWEKESSTRTKAKMFSIKKQTQTISIAKIKSKTILWNKLKLFSNQVNQISKTSSKRISISLKIQTLRRTFKNKFQKS